MLENTGSVNGVLFDETSHFYTITNIYDPHEQLIKELKLYEIFPKSWILEKECYFKHAVLHIAFNVIQFFSVLNLCKINIFYVIP